MTLFFQLASARPPGGEEVKGPFRLTARLLLALLLVIFPARAVFSASAPSEESADISSWRMASVPANATSGLGSWIWSEKTFDKQTCRLWRSFEIPAGAKVKLAQIKMTVDNGYRLSLDGRELGQGAEWRALTEYDITELLPPGWHVLAVSAFNEFFQAGLILDLQIELNDGRIIDIKSDQTWRVAPESDSGWETKNQPGPDWSKVQIVTPLGAKPWDGRWPLDFVSVPRFHLLVIPFWRTGWFYLVLALFCGIILLVCGVLMIQLALKSNEQRALHQERARIARDIHDDFGTRLTKIILESEVAQRELAADERLWPRFAKIGNDLRDVLGAMDEVLWAVNPRRDTVRDFVVFVCEHAQTFLQATSIQCFLDVEPDMPGLDFELPLRRSLLLAVKEALGNAAKHSGATRLVLRIHRGEPGLIVIVEDNGKGFDPARVNRDRSGLTNMIERLSEVGGNSRIVSAPGNGCQVEFGIPLTRRDPWLGLLGRRRSRRCENKAEIQHAGKVDN